MQIAAEEITGCRKAAPCADHYILRRANEPLRHALLPRRLAVAERTKRRERFVRDILGHGEQTDLRVIGMLDLLLRTLDHVDAHFHVRLPGANPDIADEHV